MSDNDTLPATGDVIRSKDRSGVKTQIVGQDLNPGGVSEVLMTAAALADGASNPTIPSWASMGMVFNESTWDRVRGDTTNGVDVDVTRVGGTVTVGGVAATDAAVSGNPLLDGGRASTAAPTAMSTDGDAVPLWTDRRGALHTVPGAAGSRTISGVAASATSVSILSSNTSRRGVLIHNNSSAPLYLKYGATASIASGGYSVKIPADGYWEMPNPIDQGALDGIWSVASGYANVTELS